MRIKKWNKFLFGIRHQAVFDVGLGYKGILLQLVLNFSSKKERNRDLDIEIEKEGEALWIKSESKTFQVILECLSSIYNVPQFLY